MLNKTYLFLFTPCFRSSGDVSFKLSGDCISNSQGWVTTDLRKGYRHDYRAVQHTPTVWVLRHGYGTVTSMLSYLCCRVLITALLFSAFLELFFTIVELMWTSYAFVHSHVCVVGVGFMMTERVLFLPSVGICLLLDVVVTEVQLTWLWSLRVLTHCRVQ